MHLVAMTETVEPSASRAYSVVYLVFRNLAKLGLSAADLTALGRRCRTSAMPRRRDKVWISTLGSRGRAVPSCAACRSSTGRYTNPARQSVDQSVVEWDSRLDADRDDATMRTHDPPAAVTPSPWLEPRSDV